MAEYNKTALKWNYQEDKTEINIFGPYEERKEIDSEEMQTYLFIDIFAKRVHGDKEDFALVVTKEQAAELSNVLAQLITKEPVN